MRLKFDPRLISDGNAGPNLSQTHAGMAHFSGTGPHEKKCKHCRHINVRAGYKNGNCLKWKDMMSSPKFGPSFPVEALACKYFEQAKTK